MIIQLNTDTHIDGTEALARHVTTDLERALARYAHRITRVEVHFRDENAVRRSANDKRCMLEARIAGEDPLAVTNTADSVHGALVGARDKLMRVLEKRFAGR